MSRMAMLMVLFLALSWASGSALAHKPSDSYLALTQRPGGFDGQWDIALRDLDLAIGLDANGDGDITWGELRARKVEISGYALGRLQVLRGTEACDLTPGDLQVDTHTDGTYAVLRFEAACRGAAALTVDYRLLFDRDPQHRGLLRVANAEGVQSAVLSPENPRQVFEASANGRWQQFATFVADGVKHIAIGFDHILFLVALLLPAVMVREGRTWRPVSGWGTTLRHVVGIVTAFTVAHSITLSLGTLGVVRPPSRWVESLIALSVALTALDNVVPFLPRQRWQVAFAFGLLHGFGFASVLLDLGLPAGALALSLFGFNLGVEIGQLILLAFLLPLAFVARDRAVYTRVALHAGSAVIAFIALGWLVERSFSLAFMPF